MTTLESFNKAATDDKLIVAGRYKIPGDDGQPVSYQRVTNFVKLLRDTYTLEKWGKRMVAVGLARRPDLLARVAACTVEEKRELDRLCEQATEAASASAGANFGTALHAFTEQLDRGEQPYAPAPLDADIYAYKAAVEAHGINMSTALMEQIVVVPDIGVAGRFDRIAEVRGWELPAITDLKTGGYLDTNEIAMQLALYSRAAYIYDPVAQQRVDMPAVDQERALVVHLPVGQATCTMIVIDIAAGWEAVQQAMWVREWRKRSVVVMTLKAVADSQPANGGTTGGAGDRSSLPTTTQPPALPDTSHMVGHVPVNRDTIAARVRALEHIPGAIGRLGGRLRELELPRLSECTEDWQLISYASCVSQTEREVGAPFMPAELAPFATEPDPFRGLPGSGVPPDKPSSMSHVDERPGDVEQHHPVAPSPGLLARYDNLPADLRLAVDAARQGTVLEGCNIRSGGTAEQVEQAAKLIVAAELDHDKRKAYIASLVQGLDDDMVEVLRCATAGVA